MNLNIKRAYVARFNDTSISDYSMKLFIDEKTTEHCNCLINDENSKAIDIDNKCVYHILERNSNGIITRKEAENIILGVPYVLDMQNIKWEEVGIIEKRVLGFKAFLANIEYKREKKEVAKVKVITRKDSKIE